MSARPRLSAAGNIIFDGAPRNWRVRGTRVRPLTCWAASVWAAKRKALTADEQHVITVTGAREKSI